jgi:dipeptidyl aminopeptidase/acylaminoacyl peptidase
MTAISPRAGLWPSEISAAKANSGITRPQYPVFHNGCLTWVESRPQEEGRNVLMVREADGSDRTLTPTGLNLRSRVYEYGGRAHAFLGDQVAFVNFEDQCIYLQPFDGGPAARLTSPSESSWRYADLVVLPHGLGLIAVGEHHVAGGEAENMLVHIGLDAPATPRVLYSGPDFVAMPVISPDGQRLAWIEWDHPCMQWDASRLMCALLLFDDSGAQLGPSQDIAGGPGRSVWQPLFLRDGSLVFSMDDELTDRAGAGFWQLYRWQGRGLERLTHEPADHAEPFWVSGERRIVELEGGGLLAVYTDAQGEALVRVPLDGSGASSPLARLPSMLQLSPCPGGVLLAGSDGDAPGGIYSWTPAGLQRRVGAEAPLSHEWVSRGVPLSSPSRDGEGIHSWYYPPCQPGHALAQGEHPPLIVKAHGGPTSSARAGFELEIQFWTSRGFAFVDVNYRGSTGLGRAYRQALQGRWGELDIDDVVDVVEHLVQTGRADREGVFIRGGSAGGYVVLRALTRDPEIWAGGACRYGIGNLGTLAATTHKFEARYIDGLMGQRWAEGAEHRPGNPYHDRSPIFFIDRLRAPVILFQGSEDKVVPPEVSREMVQRLERAGVPNEYHEYSGEGHGFRKAENRVHSLEAELRFFQGVLERR